jgi:hypothetical protein
LHEELRTEFLANFVVGGSGVADAIGIDDDDEGGGGMSERRKRAKLARDQSVQQMGGLAGGGGGGGGLDAGESMVCRNILLDTYVDSAFGTFPWNSRSLHWFFRILFLLANHDANFKQFLLNHNVSARAGERSERKIEPAAAAQRERSGRAGGAGERANDRRQRLAPATNVLLRCYARAPRQRPPSLALASFACARRFIRVRPPPRCPRCPHCPSAQR